MVSSHLHLGLNKKSFGRTFAGYIMADRKRSEEFRDEIIRDDLGVDGWIILGWISRRWVVGMWTGLG
jgi:hypothetical protein